MHKKNIKIDGHKSISIVLIPFAIVILVVVGLVILLNGNTTTTENITTNKKAMSLVCSSTTKDHPKITNLNGSISKELKATLIFNSERLDTVGLIYTIYYPDARSVIGGESILHAELNISLAESGISEAFETKYNQYDDRLIINMDIEKDKITSKTAPYFLIDVTDGEHLDNWTIEDYKNNYLKQGFNCKQKS